MLCHPCPTLEAPPPACQVQLPASPARPLSATPPACQVRLPRHAAEHKGLDHERSLVILLAVATGVAVASNYYVQPLASDIRQTFHAGAGAAGLIVTASQIGYAAGLLLLLPLGDLLERRRLVVVLSLVTALGLVGAGACPEPRPALRRRRGHRRQLGRRADPRRLLPRRWRATTSGARSSER